MASQYRGLNVGPVTDYVEIYGYNDTGSSVNFGGALPYLNVFEVEYLGA